MLGYFEFSKRARRERRTGGAEGGDPPPPSDQAAELRNTDQGRVDLFRKNIKMFQTNVLEFTFLLAITIIKLII